MIIWGMVGNSHDASLAVFRNKKLLWACLAKDFSDVPNDPNFNWTMIESARQTYGFPDQIVWYEKPLLKTFRQWRAGQGWLYSENNIRKLLKKWDLNIPIKYTKHHLSHAAYAYYTQPHHDCAVVCLDSIGEFETLTVWHGKNGKLKKIYSQGYPHSLGLFYSAMTQRLGLVAQRDEYKVSEWAKKGNPKKYMNLVKQEIIHIDHNQSNPQHIKLLENLHRGCMWWRPEIQSQQDLYDLAATVQTLFEYAVQCITIWAKAVTNSSNIALAGGGALNRDAINKIYNAWENVWVPPNPGDPGSCIGAVLAKNKEFQQELNWYKKLI
jgi:carbamoyltransferase